MPKQTSRDLWFYAWGWLWSMWPMIGIRTMLGLGWFLALRWPKKTFIITNQIGFVPFLLLYFPHLRLGEWLWGAQRLNYTFKEMWDYVSTDPIGSLVSLVPSILHAITGWLVVSPLHLAFGYAGAWLWFRWREHKTGR